MNKKRLWRALSLVLWLFAATRCLAETIYYGAYDNGKKVGYGVSTSRVDVLDARHVTRSDYTRTTFGARRDGSLDSKEVSTTWSDAKGNTLKTESVETSGGRTIRVTVVYEGGSCTCSTTAPAS